MGLLAFFILAFNFPNRKFYQTKYKDADGGEAFYGGEETNR